MTDNNGYNPETEEWDESIFENSPRAEPAGRVVCFCLSVLSREKLGLHGTF